MNTEQTLAQNTVNALLTTLANREIVLSTLADQDLRAFNKIMDCVTAFDAIKPEDKVQAAKRIKRLVSFYRGDQKALSDIEGFIQIVKDLYDLDAETVRFGSRG